MMSEEDPINNSKGVIQIENQFAGYGTYWSDADEMLDCNRGTGYITNLVVIDNDGKSYKINIDAEVAKITNTILEEIENMPYNWTGDVYFSFDENSAFLDAYTTNVPETALLLTSADNENPTGDTAINDVEGYVRMALGNGSDVYVVNNIENGFTEIFDGAGTDDREAIVNYDSYSDVPNDTDTDTLIIRNCKPEDLALFFDVAKDGYDPQGDDEYVEDCLCIVKKGDFVDSMINFMDENNSEVTGLISIEDYFGKTNDGGTQVGSGHIKNIITVDNQGVARKIDVAAYVEAVTENIKNYLNTNTNIPWGELDGERLIDVFYDYEDDRDYISTLFTNTALTYEEVSLDDYISSGNSEVKEITSADNVEPTKDTATNSETGLVNMALGNGSDTYIVDDITKGFTVIEDGRYTGERDMEDEYNYSGTPNPDKDTLIIKNIDASDLMMFFDVSIADFDGSNYNEMADDGLLIIKKGMEIDALTKFAYEQDDEITGMISIEDQFGTTNNNDCNNNNPEVGSGYISTIKTQDSDGTFHEFNVDKYVSSVTVSVKNFLSTHTFVDEDGETYVPKTAWDVLENGTEEDIAELLSFYKNTDIEFIVSSNDPVNEDVEIVGTDNDDPLYGNSNNNIIIGGKGSDSLYGTAGYNKFVFKSGDGEDYLYSQPEGSTGADVIVFDISEKENLSYEKSGNDLVINYGDGDKVNVVDFFSNPNHSVKDIAFASDINSMESIGGISPSNIILRPGSGYTGGNAEANIVVAEGEQCNINTGTGNDTVFIDAEFAEISSDGGDDTYIVSSLDNQTFIRDFSGKDTIVLPENKDDIRFIFELHLDPNNKNIIYEPDTTDDDADKANGIPDVAGTDLEIYSAANRAYMLENDNIDDDEIKNCIIRDILAGEAEGAESCEKTIVSADGYQITYAKIKEIAEGMRQWLADRNYSCSYEPVDDPDALSTMDALFANAWTKVGEEGNDPSIDTPSDEYIYDSYETNETVYINNATGVETLKFKNERLFDAQPVNGEDYYDDTFEGGRYKVFDNDEVTKSGDDLVFEFPTDITQNYNDNKVVLVDFFKNPEAYSVKYISLLSADGSEYVKINLVDLLSGKLDDTYRRTINYQLEEAVEPAEATELTGTKFIDEICGSAGKDIIKTGDGDDVVFADGGNDVLYSQGGSNTFIFDYTPLADENNNPITDATGKIKVVGNDKDLLIFDDITSQKTDTLVFEGLVGFKDKEVYVEGQDEPILFKADMSFVRSQNEFDDLLIYYGKLDENGKSDNLVKIQDYFKKGFTKPIDIVIESDLLYDPETNACYTPADISGSNPCYEKISLKELLEQNYVKIYGIDYVSNELKGTEYADIITGGDKPDSIKGNGGDDIIYGGKGDDVIHGDDGADTIYGGEGNDELHGGKGNDTIFGGDGNDAFYGGEGENIFILKNSEGGRDYIYSDGGVDTLKFEGVKIYDYINPETGDFVNDETLANKRSLGISFTTNGDNLVISYNNTLDITDYETQDWKSHIEIVDYFKNPEEHSVKYVQLQDSSDPDKYYTLNLLKLLKNEGSDNDLETKCASRIEIQPSVVERIDGTPFNDDIYGTDEVDKIYTGTGKDVINDGLGDDIIHSEGGDKIFRYSYHAVELPWEDSDDDDNYGDNDYDYGDNDNDNDDDWNDDDDWDDWEDEPFYERDENGNIRYQGAGKDTIYFDKYSPNDKNVLYFEGLVGFEDKKVNLLNTTTQEETDEPVVLKADMNLGTSGSDLIIYYGKLDEDGLSDNYVVLKDYLNLCDNGLNLEILVNKPYLIDEETEAWLQVQPIDEDDPDYIEDPTSTRINLAELIDTATLVVKPENPDIDNVLTGSDLKDIIIGGNKNDIITGNKGNDVITGNKGNDELYGVSGNNTFKFAKGDGNDTIHSQAAENIENYTDTIDLTNVNEADVKFSKSGKDLFVHYGNGDSVKVEGYYSTAGSSVKKIKFADSTEAELIEDKIEANLVAGGSGTISASTDGQVIISGHKKDTIYTGGHSNLDIDTGRGDDTIYSQGKNNTFRFYKGAGQDTIYTQVYSGEGTDKLVFEDSVGFGTDMNFSYSGNDLIILYGEGDSVTLKDYLKANGAPTNVGSLVIQGVERSIAELITEHPIYVQGKTEGYNRISGTDISDNIVGKSGTDEIWAYGGNDILVGNKGNDYLIGCSGNNAFVFFEGDGEDNVYTQAASTGGVDTIVLGGDITKDDIYFSVSGYDLVINYGKDDRVILTDYLRNTPDAYSVKNIQFGSGSIDASNIKDTDIETLLAQGTTERLIDVINEKRISINGVYQDRNNYIYGTNFKDVMTGGNANDTIWSYDDADEIYGGAGHDTIYAGKGNDIIFGEDGWDTIWAGEGNDIIVGGKDHDYLIGESGNNAFVFYNGDGEDTVYSQAATTGGVDTIVLADVNSKADVKFTISGYDLVINYGENDRIYLSGYLYNPEASSIKNIQFGSTIKLDEIKDTDIDTLLTSGSSTESIIDLVNEQRIYVDALYPYWNNYVYGTTFRDVIKGGFGNDTIWSYDGADEIYGGAGHDTIYAGKGNDIIFGEDGWDTIWAGEGNDIIYGGTGTDYLIGEGGNNSFVFKAGDGLDYVYSQAQESTNTDTLVFAASEKSGISYSKSGNNLVVHYGNNDQVQLVDYFVVPNHSVKNIAFVSDTDSIDAVKRAVGTPICIPGEEYEAPSLGIKYTEYTGDSEDNTIIASDQYSLVFAGAGNDTIFLNSGAIETHDEAGDDRYIVTSLYNQSFICDNDGNDIIELPEYKSNIRFILEMYIDKHGNIIKKEDPTGDNDGLGSDLEIYTVASRNKMMQLMGSNQNVNNCIIRDILDAADKGSNKTIVSADGYKITTAQIQQIAETFANWQCERGFTGAYDVAENGTPAQLQEAMAILDYNFNNAWTKM